jgi:hypothetical protein
MTLAVCPATSNINNLLAGTPSLYSDSVTFTVNSNTGLTKQNYDYQFQSNFASTPSVAIGNPPLIQPCKTSPSTMSAPTPSQSGPPHSPPPVPGSSSSTPQQCGHASRSISGSVPTPHYKWASSKLVHSTLCRQPPDRQRQLRGYIHQHPHPLCRLRPPCHPGLHQRLRPGQTQRNPADLSEPNQPPGKEAHH